MFKGKPGLVAAVFTLLTLQALGAELGPSREDLAHQHNPALPSQEDLVRFSEGGAAYTVTLDALGANQRAFPVLYRDGETSSVAPASGIAVATEGGIVDTGHAVRMADGLVHKVFMSQPVPAMDEKTAFAAAGYMDYDTYMKKKDPARTTAAPSPAQLESSSLASAMPHAGRDSASHVPPTLGAKVDPDVRPPEAGTSARASAFPATPVAAATATLAMAPADGERGQTKTSAPAARPRNDAGKPASPAMPAPVTAEPTFPAPTIAPPPLPAGPAAQAPIDLASLGAAELHTGRALDGTPLPPPPPIPELPGREQETSAFQPYFQPQDTPSRPVDTGSSQSLLAVRADPAQVRADFNRLKAFCEEDALGSAAEIYARMPDFGPDEEINRLRADAANLLILGLARNDNLQAAQRIFNSVPADMPGYDANLAKTRGVINLTTYYVRAERFTDAFDVLMGLNRIEHRSALNNELFRLMARMIPYLDNADETEKAARVFDLLLAEVKSPGTATLFADNIPGVLRYYLHYVDRSENPVARRVRMDFLEHMYDAMGGMTDSPEIRTVRQTVGMALADRYAGDPERAARFLEN